MQKFERVVFVLLGDVNLGTVGILQPMRARIGATKVKVLGRKFAVVPFADMADVIAVGSQ